jgi:hypothetical protein
MIDILAFGVETGCDARETGATNEIAKGDDVFGGETATPIVCMCAVSRIYPESRYQLDALLNRQPLTLWEQYKLSPLLFLSRLLYTPPIQFKQRPDKIHIVCISDTHNTHNTQPPLPNGDIPIHAGDLTVSGTKHELDNVLSWLESQPHPHKFFIGGNHDTSLAVDPEIHEYISSTYPSLIYLQESSAQVTIRGRTLRVYGSPYTPQYGSWVFQ